MRIGNAQVVVENDTVPIYPPLDAWVYPQGKYLTMLEAGERTPVVPAETTPILLAGGVRVNGISATRKPYPFWMFDTIKQPLSAETELFYVPTYRYLADTLLRYLVKEDFESPQVSFRSTNAGEPGAVQLRRTFSERRRGFWAGEAELPPNGDLRIESTVTFEFPQAEVWAEIAIKGTRNLGLGLTREDKQTGRLINREIFLLLRPPDEGWGAFFIDLTPWMSQGAGLYRYRLYLTSVGDTTGAHVLYIDDIRVLTFKTS
ncbi:MAG: hypothetical protein ABDH66_03500 [Bacteroidia bacterium]